MRLSETGTRQFLPDGVIETGFGIHNLLVALSYRFWVCRNVRPASNMVTGVTPRIVPFKDTAV